MPEKKNIISVSWDKTIRIWKGYTKQKKVRKLQEESKKFDTWVFDEMKVALKNSQLASASSSSVGTSGDGNTYLTDLEISNFNF